MILDRIDPFIRFEWSMRYKNPDGSRYLPIGFSEITNETPIVKDAFQLIEKYWMEMANHISSTIQVVHLVKSPYRDRHMSCTSELFFGSILTSTGNEFQLAEALVHEYSHNLLNMVILAGEIFEGHIPQEKFITPHGERILDPFLECCMLYLSLQMFPSYLTDCL